MLFDDPEDEEYNLIPIPVPAKKKVNRAFAPFVSPEKQTAKEEKEFGTPYERFEEDEAKASKAQMVLSGKKVFDMNSLHNPDMYKALPPFVRRQLVKCFAFLGATPEEMKNTFGVSRSVVRTDMIYINEANDPATRKELLDLVAYGFTKHATMIIDLCSSSIERIHLEAKPAEDCKHCHGTGYATVGMMTFKCFCHNAINDKAIAMYAKLMWDITKDITKHLEKFGIRGDNPELTQPKDFDITDGWTLEEMNEFLTNNVVPERSAHIFNSLPVPKSASFEVLANELKDEVDLDIKQISTDSEDSINTLHKNKLG